MQLISKLNIYKIHKAFSWIQVDELNCLLIAGSKGGLICIFLVNESCSLLYKFLSDDKAWITSIQVSDLTKIARKPKDIAPSGNIYFYIGFSTGKINKYQVELDNGEIEKEYKLLKTVNKADGLPVTNIGVKMIDKKPVISYSKGCNLYMQSKDSPRSSHHISSQYLTGFSWLNNNLIGTSAMEGELKIWKYPDMTIEKEIPVFQPNWGLFGMDTSCSQTHICYAIK